MFIARQPIFNKAMNVYGYELLYRDNIAAKAFNDSSAVIATATVLGGLFELGINDISNNKKSFVNFDYDFLFSDSIELIEPGNMIIEILEDTHIDDKLINRIKELREKGYRIALDDFTEKYDRSPLVPYSDIIKYDLIKTPLDSIKREVNLALIDKKILVAEKVETKEEYETALEMGFHLFQGFFFERPNIIGKTNIIKSPKLSYIEILNELKKQEPSYTKLTDIIKTDVNLTYRMLQTAKQCQSDSDDFVDNIKKSLVYMGFKQIERWINILLLQDLATNKPVELIRLSLIRSHFGESLSKRSNFKPRTNEVFGMLLFSTLDAILDQPMEKALDGIFLTQDVKSALISEEGDLNLILQLVYFYEKGSWEKVRDLSNEINIDEEEISQHYMDAIVYCDELLKETYNKA